MTVVIAYNVITLLLFCTIGAGAKFKKEGLSDNLNEYRKNK